MKSLVRFTLVFCLGTQLIVQSCSNADTVEFLNGNEALQIPFESRDHYIVLSVTVNDSLDLDMILDTGFGNKGAILLDPEMGGRLHLSFVSKIPLGGGGDTVNRMANIAVGASLSLPGVRFVNQQLLVLDNGASFENWAVDGIIGGTLFDCIVEIDYENSVLNLYGRNAYDPVDSGQKFQLAFSYEIPVIEAMVNFGDGRTKRLKLLVDTGVPYSLSLFTYSGSGIHSPQSYITVTDQGLNGTASFELGRVSGIQIGPFEIIRPLAAYMSDVDMGTAVILGQDGFLGNGTLKRFKVTFDYPGKRMFLKSNTMYPGTSEYNMAGLVLQTLPNGKMLISDVVGNSPADTNGIRGGDLLIEVNGRALHEYKNMEIHELFLQEGKSVTVTIERESEQFNRTLTLRRLI